MPSHIDAARTKNNIVLTIKILIQMEGCNNTTIELTVNVKRFDKAKGELIDAISAGAKLTKADAGRILDHPDVRTIEDFVNLNLEYCGEANDGGCGCPKIAASSHSKLTKADAGRTV